ncbi:M13 family metallopeptidase [Compostibacter hankyongensis]|uniref:M13 family peptidase n=1 Tax=Compostibacter hankyongensis TaxID=1007089 RepID=A0ABP8FLC5_9BACT
MNNTIFRLLPFAVLPLLVGYGCKPSVSGSQGKSAALDLSGADSSISPREDFFSFANGRWVQHTEIPASKTGWGSFYVVRDQALYNMRSILDSCSGLDQAQKGSITQQIGDLYASGMDSAGIEKAGLTPLKANLDRIDAISDVAGVLQEVTTEYVNGDGALFSFSVGPDDKNSTVERPHLDQGGLGMPNRDYYFKQDPASRETRQAYLHYIATILSLSGTADTAAASKKAGAVLALETRLADASKTPVELRDPEANYHLLTFTSLSEMTPGVDWKSVAAQLSVKEDTVQVGQPEFYKALASLLKTTPVDVWKDYLRVHLISGYAAWLSTPFADAHFDFYNRQLGGQKQPEERWKRVSSLVNSALGDALGQLYVQRFFPPSAKEYMIKLVDNLQRTYQDRIRQVDWMSDSTKTKAIQKLNAFAKKIGYPDKWKDYSSIDINRSSVVGNLQRIGKWQYDYNISKLGKPVDRSEWYMTAPTVNAYYNPSFNEIVFPAGILQPPFYYQNGDDAVNYGGIAAVIGHEMTHGFDDQGSQYDKDGNLKSWWTKEDRRKFDAKTGQVADQYDQYTVLDSVHVNGKLTLGENIADIGGLAIAYAAFKNTPQGKSDKKIDGLTPDQRFFLSFAQIWRIKNTDRWMLWRINNDPHSPEMYRVNGPVSNMKSFYAAFGVQPGDKMYRADSSRVHIW